VYRLSNLLTSLKTVAEHLRPRWVLLVLSSNPNIYVERCKVKDERCGVVNNSATIKSSNSWGPWLALAGILLFSAWLRYNLIDVPLERDEGEYAYGGQLFLQGIPPYSQLYNMKLPGIYAVYAAIISVFGATHAGIHLGLLVANILAGIFLFLLTRELAGVVAGLVAAACFAVISIGQPVQGIFANSEHFVIVPMLAGFFLLAKSRKGCNGTLFLAGFLLGLSFIIKQHGALFIAGAGIYLLIDFFRDKPYKLGLLVVRIGLFSVGVFLPYIATCLLFLWAGLFDKFWFWTIEYASAYASQVAWQSAIGNLRYRLAEIFAVAPAIWILAALGVPTLFLTAKTRKNAIFIYVFVVFSILAICPGLFFRPHYFVLLLPAAAMLAGISAAVLVNLNKWPGSKGIAVTTCLIVSACLGHSIYKQHVFLFKMTPEQIVRATYWPNPFIESLPIAKYIKEHIVPADKIAVIGSEPQIYFYADRQSASGYIYMYPLMELHDFAGEMQKDLIKEVEAAQPEFLVFVRINFSWLQKVGSSTLIYDWFQGYKENYDRVALIEIFGKASTYYWQPNVKWPPTSPYWIEVLKKH
jgi:hypothetical protein